MNNYKYKIEVNWSEEDHAFVARVPELEGVVTHGDQPEEALRMAHEAIALHLESLNAHHEEIPEPISIKSLSGNYQLRMPKTRHEDAAIKARSQGKSLNEYLNDIIDKDLNSNLTTQTEWDLLRSLLKKMQNDSDRQTQRTLKKMTKQNVISKSTTARKLKSKKTATKKRTG